MVRVVGHGNICVHDNDVSTGLSAERLTKVPRYAFGSDGEQLQDTGTPHI